MDALLLVVQVLVIALAAPLVQGAIKTSKARWQLRRGPSVLQPYRDVAKLIARESVVSDRASWVFTIAPFIYGGSLFLAALLIPTVSKRPALPGIGDAIVFIGLLALGRFALALAALDTASNFGGMGASREVTFSALIEPGIMMVMFAVALPAGSTSLAAMTRSGHLGVGDFLALGALLIATITETGRIPIDNPDTHLELTMAHEGMILEVQRSAARHHPLGDDGQTDGIPLLDLGAFLSVGHGRRGRSPARRAGAWARGPPRQNPRARPGAWRNRVLRGKAARFPRPGPDRIRECPRCALGARHLRHRALLMDGVIGGATAANIIDGAAIGLIGLALFGTIVRRMDQAVLLLACQGILLGVASCAVALNEMKVRPWLAFVVALSVKAVIIPEILRRQLRRHGIQREAESVISVKMAFPAAVALVPIAYRALGPYTDTTTLAFRAPNALPAAMALILLGLFTMVIRKQTVTEVIGVVTMENGLYLAADAATRGLPFAVEFGVAFDVLTGVAVMGLVMHEIHHRRDVTIRDIGNTDRLRSLTG